jgi:hypothetical protein
MSDFGQEATEFRISGRTGHAGGSPEKEAVIIGADATTIYNWEIVKLPPSQVPPRITDFLGCEPPLSMPRTLGGKILDYRYIRAQSEGAGKTDRD